MGADANRLLTPLLQLPELAVIAFPPVPFHPRDKLAPITRYAGHRPLAWIDDALPPQAHTWAAIRRRPTLLISIDPAEGLTRPAIDQATALVARIAHGAVLRVDRAAVHPLARQIVGWLRWWGE
jgi:hypothetical protein